MVLPLLLLLLATAWAGGPTSAQVEALGAGVHARYLAPLPEVEMARRDVVQRVVRRLAARLPGPLRRRDWRVVLLDEARPDAVVLPDGHVVVTSGLLPLMGTEAGLAAVLGHLMAHVAAGDGARRVGNELVHTGLAEAGALSADDPTFGPQLAADLGAGTFVGVVLPFPRADELAADAAGLLLMARAGYDPRAAAPTWARLVEVLGNRGTRSLLSSHPTSSERRAALDAAAADAGKAYGKARDPLGQGVRLGG